MEARQEVLRKMRICRFCLNDDTPQLLSIHEKRPTRDTTTKQSVPLPLQIMACVAIEVFANDGMPQMICKRCRHHTEQAYNFKQTCKQSDDALKLFLATGTLHKPAKRPAPLDADAEDNDDDADHRADANAIERPKKVLRRPLAVKREITLLPDPLQLVDNDLEGIAEEVIETVSDNMEIVNEEYDEEEEEDADAEDRINPILKVPQVTTNVYPCTACERSFPLQQLLDIHMRIHERERNHECDQCERKFFTKYDLSKHLLIHTDAKPYACVVCLKQFSREGLLHRHEKIHVDVPKYLCTACDKTFLNKEDLDAHAQKHKKRRPFACRLCPKSFVFKQGLERHEQTHADQKPHKCNYCEASFTSPIKLTRHITSHAGLRPYPCKLCGRTFLLSHHLTRHMRSHYANNSPHGTPIGQHKCDTCSMSFKRKDSLINHSAIHSMVNLKCVICNTAFETAKMVKEHITTHLSGLPYPCDNCDYSFESQEQLEEHELKHAEMEYEEQIEKEISMEAAAEQQQQQQQDEAAHGGDVFGVQRDEDLEEEVEEEEEDDEEEEEGQVVQFTITNTENPEVVPSKVAKQQQQQRHTRAVYQPFRMDDELEEDEVVVGGRRGDDEEPESSDGEAIKPVVRTEGTRMYARKQFPKMATTTTIAATPTFKSLDLPDSNQLDTLEELGLTKQAVNALPNKKYVDMKVGARTVRVQKLMMTKAEIEAMAKEGRIEMKAGTILLRKPPKKAEGAEQARAGGGAKVPAQKPITFESAVDDFRRDRLSPPPIVKKTYTRRSMAVVRASEEGEGQQHEHRGVKEEKVERSDEI